MPQKNVFYVTVPIEEVMLLCCISKFGNSQDLGMYFFQTLKVY